MQPITIHITETAGITRRAEVVKLGIPFAREWHLGAPVLAVVDERTGMTLPCQFKPLARWPEGGLRWLSVALPVQLESNGSARFLLQPAQAMDTAMLSVESDSKSCTVNTGTRTFQLDQTSLLWESGAIRSCVELLDAEGQSCSSHIDGGWQVIDNGAVYLILQARGQWRKNNEPFAQFDCRLHFQHNSDTVSVEFCIHNPQRARHSGGLWDLGDPGSIHFRSLCVVTRVGQNTPTELQPEAGDSSITADADTPVRIHQHSSGGEHWNSKNHVDASGNVSVRFRGFKIDRNGATIKSGERASPILRSGDMAVALKQFWQQFPSALSVCSHQITVELFPAEQESIHELQAGERKHKTCYLDYAGSADSLLWTRAPLQPTLDPAHYEAADAFPWFTANGDTTELESLIPRGIEGPSNFFIKREIIDEYGWRNFGDLFADHETLYQKAGESPLISHYNNQYDPIYGFARQFALSGDRRWFELMDDLARHVSDIDIYHTTEDRGEYNNGLFWHTDHYLDAHTATHRTYTRHNNTSSVAGQTGGGPAAEHCYTSGLLYHYLMTGHEPSRQAVLELAGWMVTCHEGSGGTLEQVLALKKYDIPLLQAKLKGKPATPYRYPFTRGTGNYLNALLDAWQLSLDPRWLKQAEAVIPATLHPADDIAQRDLLNAEVRWSYLVLMAAIVKYLQIKIEANQLDDAYRYARDSLTHYTRWMAQNERPFLAAAEKLEYPNDTWAAQDIRKAMLMFQAARIDPEWSEHYIAKGQEWFEYVTTTLQNSPEGHYTRILVLLMLTHGPHQACPRQHNFPIPQGSTPYSTPRLTWATLIQRIMMRVAKGIIGFRPARERAWLKARLN